MYSKGEMFAGYLQESIQCKDELHYILAGSGIKLKIPNSRPNHIVLLKRRAVKDEETSNCCDFYHLTVGGVVPETEQQHTSCQNIH